MTTPAGPVPRRSQRFGSVRSRRAFGALTASTARGRQGPVSARFVPGEAADGVQVAYSIGRKVGNAVVRNRIRRRARAIVRDMDLAAGLWLFAFGPSATALSFEQLYAHMCEAARGAAR